MLQYVVAATLLALQLAAIWAVFKAIRNARTPQGAVGWVVFLLAAPHFALPVFLFLGHSRMPRRVEAHRSSKRGVAALADFERTHPTRVDIADPPLRRVIEGFERLAEMPAVSGNGAELLIDGPEAFAAMFEAIDAAQSYVLVQFYILRDDEIGRAMQERLIRKAQAGCTVRVIYDAIGSHGLPWRYLAALREAGVEVADFHSLSQPHSRFQINFRNHRKIVVVDGRVGFLGGLNVGEEYCGRDPHFGHWRDTHLRISGPIVAQLQMVFVEDWHWATAERLDLDWTPPEQGRGVDALILPQGPADLWETGTLYFCNAIHAARDRIWIASPYFVPDMAILSALSLAAMRGVDVRVLVADKRDHWLVWLAAFAHFDEMLDAGVELWRYSDGFMHQKVLVVDEAFASVGTLNLDNRSCSLNFEVTALVFDGDFARRVTAMLEADFQNSYRYQTRLDQMPNPVKRNAARIARLMAPLL
jgi:cardiolipin synthase